jgi:hypothetical protein
MFRLMPSRAVVYCGENSRIPLTGRGGLERTLRGPWTGVLMLHHWGGTSIPLYQLLNRFTIPVGIVRLIKYEIPRNCPEECQWVHANVFHLPISEESS